LREPLTSIKKSQIVVINGKKNSEFENKIKNISSNINIYYSYYLPTNLINFKDHKLLAFAGIGNPENFFSLLKENNLNVVKKMPFPDHYNYSINELNEIVNFSLKNNLKIITTEKDFFRIKHFQIAQIKCLNVELKILNSEVFEKDVIKYL
jgi:tetraacyldisaccharide 4'-kinase